MTDGVTFVLMGILIGAVIPFVAGWITFDRNLHDLISESEALRQEAQSLRNLAQSLVGQFQASEKAAVSTTPKEIDLLEDSVSSFAVEREISGLNIGSA